MKEGQRYDAAWSCTFPTPPGTGIWKLRMNASPVASGGGGVNYPTQPNPELVRIAKPVHNCAALLSTELSRDSAQKCSPEMMTASSATWAGRQNKGQPTPLSANRETQSSLITSVPSKRAHPSGPQHDEATANCTGSRPGGLASRQETSLAELADADRVAQVPDSSSTRRQWHKRHGYDMQMH